MPTAGIMVGTKVPLTSFMPTAGTKVGITGGITVGITVGITGVTKVFIIVFSFSWRGIKISCFGITSMEDGRGNFVSGVEFKTTKDGRLELSAEIVVFSDVDDNNTLDTSSDTILDIVVDT